MDVKADKIRERRLLRGWSQEQFAQIAGTTTRTIQRIEAWQGASLETVKAVASALDCDFRELISLAASDLPLMQSASVNNKSSRGPRKSELCMTTLSSKSLPTGTARSKASH
jgi:transcriptional regulator with XRE-family HTH domain